MHHTMNIDNCRDNDSPVLNRCKELVKEGYDPNDTLIAYRNGEVSLTVTNIGLAAKLRVSDGRFKLDPKFNLKGSIKAGTSLAG